MTLLANIGKQTALVFPPGGAHWPGMGSDLELYDNYQAVLEEAEAGLRSMDVAPGSLQRLMAGENQMTRSFEEAGWQWRGDFPLSVAAQTVLGVALGRAFIAVQGKPGAIAGESMGEIAAYCVAGALDLSDAVILAYHWARAYQKASAALGLKMAVVDALTQEQIDEVAPNLGIQIVVFESKTLFVVALPEENLTQLESTATNMGGRALISNNPCAAHDPRLKGQPQLWQAHLDLIQTLKLHPPSLPLLSVLQAATELNTEHALRDNLLHLSFTPIHWGDTIRALPGLGIRNVLQLGIFSRPYSLERMQDEYPSLQNMRVKGIKTVAGIYTFNSKARLRQCS